MTIYRDGCCDIQNPESPEHEEEHVSEAKCKHKALTYFRRAPCDLNPLAHYGDERRTADRGDIRCHGGGTENYVCGRRWLCPLQFKQMARPLPISTANIYTSRANHGFQEPVTDCELFGLTPYPVMCTPSVRGDVWRILTPGEHARRALEFHCGPSGRYVQHRPNQVLLLPFGLSPDSLAVLAHKK